jgi:polyvinyl alcohol dehydrogenase (cytochrome)
MKRSFWLLAFPLLVLLFACRPASAQTVQSLRLFEEHCTSCHGSPNAPAGAPDGLALRKLSPEAVYAALNGPTHAGLQDVSDNDKRMIAEYLGGRKVDVEKVASAKLMPNQCASNPPIKSLSASPAWNGWGVDTSNSRFETAKAAGISAGQVPQLKLKWAFGFPEAEEVYGQPSVVAGRVFVGVDTGNVYSIDAATGCVYWSFQADAGVRTAVSVGPVKGQGSTKFAAYFGDVKANLYAVDVNTGKQLWKLQVDDNPVARITGAPALYEGRLYVPVASSEERAAGYSSTYPCCTFRGSVSAVDANTGKRIWQTYIIPDAPKSIGKSAKGIEHFSPSGGGVWNTPTIDAAHRTLYIGTGDAYTEPVPKTTDAVMAISMDTGKVLWFVQDTENDAWLSGCARGSDAENCPKDMGPDYDFGSSPILRTLPNGKRLLIAGQKSGMVWAHDPDHEGAVVWKAQLVDKLALGMITFGGAADSDTAYFGLRTGGIAAVQIATGEKKWFTALPPASQGAPRGENAALSEMPGAIFSGGWDGVLRALSSSDGHVLWEYNMVHDYTTVNGVAGKGGAMGAAGPTVAGGMLFAGSGYVFGGGIPGNVLLAFGPN